MDTDKESWIAKWECSYQVSRAVEKISICEGHLVVGLYASTAYLFHSSYRSRGWIYKSGYGVREAGCFGKKTLIKREKKTI